MIAEKLRKSILQAAIQGKLTEQLSDDGDARELLAEIKAEKARLVKEGKIKKEKPLPDITEDEIPFDIPENWCWGRLGDVVINRDAERKPVSKIEREGLRKEYDYYGASGVIDKIDGYLFSEELLLIGEDGANLINRSTPIAFIARGKYWVNNHAHVLRMTKGIIIEYLCYYVNAISLAQYVTGTAQPKMNQQKMNSIIVSIPPVKEQERIVERLKTIFPEIDKLEKDELKIQLLQKSFPKKMKDALLQAAIQGKLTEQLESDGDARALVADIQKEKARLIKEGKIKKEKDLPEISEEEIPFEIPDNWCWVRLGDISQYIQRGKSPKYSTIKKYPVIAQKCIQWQGLQLEKAQFIDPETIAKYAEKRMLQEEDLMWNSTGLGTLGRIGVYIEDKNVYGFAVADSHVTVIRTIKKLALPKYVFAYISGPYIQNIVEDISSGSTKQKELATDTVKKVIVPLPPIAEQYRIVERLEQLLPLCDALE